MMERFNKFDAAGERPYVCGRCGRRFRESGTLVKHSQSKVSCVEKSDRQLVRYGATLPLPPHDNKVTNDKKNNVANMQAFIFFAFKKLKS